MLRVLKKRHRLNSVSIGHVMACIDLDKRDEAGRMGWKADGLSVLSSLARDFAVVDGLFERRSANQNAHCSRRDGLGSDATVLAAEVEVKARSSEYGARGTLVDVEEWWWERFAEVEVGDGRRRRCYVTPIPVARPGEKCSDDRIGKNSRR